MATSCQNQLPQKIKKAMKGGTVEKEKVDSQVPRRMLLNLQSTTKCNVQKAIQHNTHQEKRKALKYAS